jgi:hypothetical protein
VKAKKTTRAKIKNESKIVAGMRGAVAEALAADQTGPMVFRVAKDGWRPATPEEIAKLSAKALSRGEELVKAPTPDHIAKMERENAVNESLTEAICKRAGIGKRQAKLREQISKEIALTLAGVTIETSIRVRAEARNRLDAEHVAQNKLRRDEILCDFLAMVNDIASTGGAKHHPISIEPHIIRAIVLALYDAGYTAYGTRSLDAPNKEVAQ